MRRFIVFGLATALLAAAPALAREPAHSREQLDALFDRIWAWQLRSHPEFATYVGVAGYDDRWTDHSLEAIAARQREEREFLRELEAVDVDPLDESARLDLELIRKSFEISVEGFRFHSEYLALTQLDGVQIDVAQLMESMPTGSIADFENRIARLRAVPALIDQSIALLERGLATGITQPRIALREIPEQIRSLLTDDPAESPLLLSFAQLPDEIPAADGARLRAAARQVVADAVYPAYRKLLGFVEQRYLPGARESIALSALPDGRDWYAYNARYHTTTSLTPDAIHELGLAEVTRIRAEMDGILRDIGFDGSFAEFGEFLRGDPQFYFETPDQLLDAYRAICKKADPELVKLFGKLPRLPYGVKPVPDFQAASAPTAYYQPGSLQSGRPAYFFANTYELSTRPSWEMEALALHEGVPGHHLQIALSQEREQAHDLLRYNFYTAFVEGWGLYAESLGERMGFYSSPYSKLGRLTYEIWRAIRLVVDTGMHARGWSRERAIEFFKQNAPKDEHDVVVEVDRYIVWPGQALAYKIGELKLQALRELAQRRLGAAFDIRAFHDQILLRGALPLDVLEQRMREWLDAQVGRN
ncbi:MAG TPA: DUF885 domain-containing protein [Myxococcota bacterium]|nr:DUF885 domain-containing protein [Myxococcota bacterium]